MENALNHEKAPSFPSKSEVALAQESSRKLATKLHAVSSVQIQLLEQDGHTETLGLPPSALRHLLDILQQFANGHAVAVVPLQAELSTQQAADLLNVSRPYLIQLLESGQIPFRKVGTHRRIAFEDLMAYKRQNQSQRRQALDELVALSQEMGLE